MSQIALITGAGRTTGLGLEVCRQLAAKGFSVIVTARNGDDAQRNTDLLLQKHPESTLYPLKLDVTEANDIDQAASWVKERLGRLDVLVNNAAVFGTSTEEVASADLAQSQQILEVNFYGAWRMCQAFLPLLRQSPSGRIVNVTSGSGSFGDMKYGLNSGVRINTSYSISKTALNALTVRLAKEERRRGFGVLINAVCPGWVATRPGDAERGARPVEEGAAGIVWAATLPKDGPTGQLFRDGNPLPW
ncbi:MAG: SDR family NAD(P)-dependent oxidoreductase [Chitinophagales bacterium]|nr:SDR family NAD(P)-dependent oxidoreductase [Chitinophagales bacterium]